MPLLPPVVALNVATGLASTGHIGLAMPKLAQAVGVGVSLWAAQATVNVVGAGVVGTGIATLPLLVPPPLFLAALQAAFLASGLTGFFSPLTVIGLSTGITTSFPAGIMLATVVGVGTGAGVARIVSPPAFPAFQTAFASFGMTSSDAVKLARALGMAFDTTFASFLTPIPIVGPGGPAPGSGIGTGKLV